MLSLPSFNSYQQAAIFCFLSVCPPIQFFSAVLRPISNSNDSLREKKTRLLTSIRAALCYYMTYSSADVYYGDLILLSGWDAKIVRRSSYWSSSPPKPRKKAWSLNTGVVVPPFLFWLLPTACVLTGTFLVHET